MIPPRQCHPQGQGHAGCQKPFKAALASSCAQTQTQIVLRAPETLQSFNLIGFVFFIRENLPEG